MLVSTRKRQPEGGLGPLEAEGYDEAAHQEEEIEAEQAHLEAANREQLCPVGDGSEQAPAVDQPVADMLYQHRPGRESA